MFYHLYHFKCIYGWLFDFLIPLSNIIPPYGLSGKLLPLFVAWVIKKVDFAQDYEFECELKIDHSLKIGSLELNNRRWLFQDLSATLQPLIFKRITLQISFKAVRSHEQ